MDDLADLGAPACPLHLVPMVVAGDAPDGRDARWTCPIEGCDLVRVA